MSNFKYTYGPEILIDSMKSHNICPFTRHYCTPLCALANVDVDTNSWKCGLVKHGNVVRYVKESLNKD